MSSAGCSSERSTHYPVLHQGHRVAMETMANSEAIAVRLQKTCMAQRQRHQNSSIHAMTIPATHHDVERFEGLLLVGLEPLHPFDQELQVGLDHTEIGALGITSRHYGVVIVLHCDVMPEHG
jgi:hypothetical protein